MKAIEIILKIYRSLLKLSINGRIPINLRHKAIIGATQDDPFDNWVQLMCEESLGEAFSIFNTGKLQTPDLIIRHNQSSEIVGVEVKKVNPDEEWS